MAGREGRAGASALAVALSGWAEQTVGRMVWLTVKRLTIQAMLFRDINLDAALESGQFVPYFQPLVGLRSGSLEGFEVLARWNHPRAGLVMPNEFIGRAEKEGWIGELTRELLRAAFLRMSEHESGLTLAVNISPVQLRDVSLAKQIRATADQTGFSLNHLMVEITESALTENLEQALLIARELKSMGCRLALDDFGTGYSSLLHLQSLPFDELKVDRSFVGSMTERRESRKIVGAVLGLGQNLGLTTVAEGVESEDQAGLLRWMGCDVGQGWLYGRPIPSEQLKHFLESFTGRPAQFSPRSGTATLLEDLCGLPSERLAQLQAVYDGAPVGLGFVNTQVRYVNLNHRLADMNGFTVEEHIGRHVTEIIPELSGPSGDALRQSLAGEVMSNIEINLRDRRTGTTRTVLLSYEPVRDEASEVIGVSLAAVDISERKRAEEALRESEDHYRHTVELNPQIPWLMDVEGRNIEVSARWEATTGLTREQTSDDGWMDALHPDDRSRVAPIIEDSIRSLKPIDVEYRVRQPDGRWIWMRSRGSPRFDSTGKVMRWYGSVEDIDQRKRMEEELRASEARLQAVFDSVPVGIILADAPEGTLRMANPEAKRLIGDPVLPGPSNKNFSNWWALKDGGEMLTCEEYPLARALRGEATNYEELLCQFADGSKRWLGLSGAPIRGENGAIAGGVIVVQDTDAAKRELKRLLEVAETVVSKLRART
jgi:PAS domain S-box-containing protein